MVGIVLVSHSQKLALAVAEFAAVMAPEAVIIDAGGLEDGSFGTSFDQIYQAVERADASDGVVVLMDLGSSVMTTEMVLEAYGSDQVKMADCPLVEGALVAAMDAVAGMSLGQILEDLKKVGTTPKF